MNRSLVVFMMLGGSLLAQNSPPPAPAPPYIRTIAPGTAWTVTITDPQTTESDEAPAEDHPEKKRGILPVPTQLTAKLGTNGVMEGTIDYSDKSQERFYIARDTIIQASSNSQKMILTPVARSRLDPSSLRVPFLPGTSWLSKSNFVGREKKGGESILHFYYVEMIGDPPRPAPKLEAWIRESDKQPLEVELGERVQTYSEPTPFPESIILPEKYAAALAELAKEQDAMEVIRRINQRKDQRR